MSLTTAAIRVKQEVERLGSIKAAAAAWGVHYSMVNAILNGRKQPGRTICEKLGLPHSGDRRGGPRDRETLPEGARRKPSRPVPVPDKPVEGESDEQGRLRRAAEIRAGWMPKPSPIKQEPSWRDIVRAHLCIEKRIGIRGGVACR